MNAFTSLTVNWLAVSACATAIYVAAEDCGNLNNQFVVPGGLGTFTCMFVVFLAWNADRPCGFRDGKFIHWHEL